jgi:hypothetical protein
MDRVLTMQSFRIGAVKAETRFPQTAPTNVAVKSVDCNQSSQGMEDLQDKEADRKWHRFGAGLGGSDAFVSTSFAEKNRELNSVLKMYCLYLRRGERKGFIYLLVAARGLLGSVGS